MTQAVTKEVELTRVIDPAFLTLTGKPANQIAFKVIRDDKGEVTMAAPHIQRKRGKRTDAIIYITFDEGTEDADIATTMAQWGVEEYSIETAADGKKKAKCSRADTEAETMDIRINGVVATILKPISRTDTDVKRGIAVTAVRFDLDYFPAEMDATDWLAKHSIDFSSADVENGDQGITVRRHAASEDEETKSIKVDDGVTFIVVRAEVQDVPQEYISVVNETAYGCWGWGQLDFAATLADREFCEDGREAGYILQDILDRILFYSDLPISARKDLVRSALTQYGEYIVALLDALPAQVVIASRSIREKEKSMSVQKEDKKPDAAPAADAGTTDDTPVAAISRTDVEAMIGTAMEGVSAQLAALQATIAAATPAAGEPAQRTDGTPAEGEGEPKPAGADESTQAVLRSIQDLTTAVGGVVERLQSLESSTVVRSDAGDGKQVERKDVFQGVFGGRAKA